MLSLSTFAVLAIAAQSLFTGVDAAVLPKRQNPTFPEQGSLDSTSQSLSNSIATALPSGYPAVLPGVPPNGIPGGFPNGIPGFFPSGLPSLGPATSPVPTVLPFPMSSDVASSIQAELSSIDDSISQALPSFSSVLPSIPVLPTGVSIPAVSLSTDISVPLPTVVPTSVPAVPTSSIF